MTAMPRRIVLPQLLYLDAWLAFENEAKQGGTNCKPQAAQGRTR
jgi:hypothetical protein